MVIEEEEEKKMASVEEDEGEKNIRERMERWAPVRFQILNSAKNSVAHQDLVRHRIFFPFFLLFCA